MGVFRLILSFLVVGSHVGGLGATAAGGTAVASFFTISGFLMARTISENYRGRALRFYANRIIRLGPPLLLVLVLTALLLWARDSRGFVNKPNGSYMPVELPVSLAGVVELNATSFPGFVYPQVHLAPQAWSLVVEATFYLAAPLLVWLVHRRLTPLVWAAAVGSFALTIAAVRADVEWLRSPFAAGWVFLLGMQAYFLSTSPRFRDRWLLKATRWAALLLLPIVVMAPRESMPVVTLISAPILVVCWLVVGGWQSRASRPIDRACGNLSYGLFLGHFLSTLVMYWIAELVFQRTGVFGVFGVPDESDVRLFLFSYLFAVIMAAAIYYLVERPFERVRSRVRGLPRRSVGVDAPPSASADRDLSPLT